METISVLLVENEPDVRDLFSRHLHKEPGLDVLMVEDAEAALTVLSTRRFDVLVTEWHLPGLPGNALITTTRRCYPCMKTVLINADLEVRVVARNAQADGCLVQPVVFGLGALIRKLCSSRKA